MAADERLREKEFGILDRLTPLGLHDKYPELAEQRAHVGKFYFRPPGGESWCDVILRLRSMIDTITREYRSERVLIVGHQIIVNCLRYRWSDWTRKASWRSTALATYPIAASPNIALIRTPAKMASSS